MTPMSWNTNTMSFLEYLAMAKKRNDVIIFVKKTEALDNHMLSNLKRIASLHKRAPKVTGNK